MDEIKGEKLFTLIVERLRRKHGSRYAITESVVQDVLWGLREVVIDELKFKNPPYEKLCKHVVVIPGIVKISGIDGVINLYFDACESLCKRIGRSDKQHSAFYKRLLLQK